MQINLLFKVAFLVLVCTLNTLSYSQLNSLASNVIKEKQHISDQGNGYYKNPIIPGNYGDPSIVRVNNDYYMAFSRGNGFIIWHSRDIVNWKPICRHTLPRGFKTVWAVDLQYYNNQFHLYMPIQSYPGKDIRGFGNFVVTAQDPEGPWSIPVDIEIPVPENDEYWSGIDPGFIQTPMGEKYLYVNHGYVVKLNNQGNKAVGKPQLVYEGWQYPKDWNVQCMCLESPKLFYKDGFYYLVSAEGGTNGPSTAHMTVVARSESPTGPWTNSPFNPLVHTYSQNETWWHQGHGTIFEAKDGTWWTVHHGRLKNFTELGRNTLLLPVEWTNDGWPVIKNGLHADDLIPMPYGENIGHGLRLSDYFENKKPGMQWNIKEENMENLQFGDEKLVINSIGKSVNDACSISLGAVNTSFEVSVEVFVDDEMTNAGISLANNGVQTNGLITTFTDAPEWRKRGAEIPISNKGHVYMKIKNYRKDLSFYVSNDGINWNSFGKGLREHNSFEIKLFAFGNGKAIFKNFNYQGLED